LLCRITAKRYARFAGEATGRWYVIPAGRTVEPDGSFASGSSIGLHLLKAWLRLFQGARQHVLAPKRLELPAEDQKQAPSGFGEKLSSGRWSTKVRFSNSVLPFAEESANGLRFT
jgi:hypothetical protein